MGLPTSCHRVESRDEALSDVWLAGQGCDESPMSSRPIAVVEGFQLASRFDILYRCISRCVIHCWRTLVGGSLDVGDLQQNRTQAYRTRAARKCAETRAVTSKLAFALRAFDPSSIFFHYDYPVESSVRLRRVSSPAVIRQGLPPARNGHLVRQVKKRPSRKAPADLLSPSQILL